MSRHVKSCQTHPDFTKGCDGCRRQAARYENERILARAAGRPLSMPAVGTQRRLRALHRIGWPWRTLAERLGMDERHFWSLVMRRGTTRPDKAAAVAALYDELWDVPGPSARAVQNAERRGWAPPLAYDDDTIDDPAAEPQGIATYSHTRADDERIAQLTDQGLPAAVIAQMLGCSTRAVTRSRARGREVAA